MIEYYLSNNKYIFNYALKLCKYKVEDAEDLMQDVIVKVIGMKDKDIYNKSLKSFWITIMKNLYVDQFRRKKIVHKVELSSVRKLSIQPNIEIDSEIIMEEVNKLTSNKRDIMKRVVEGYNGYQLEEEFRMTGNTIRSNIFQARKKLKKILTTKGLL